MLEIDLEERLLNEARQHATVAFDVRFSSLEGAKRHFQLMYQALSRIGKMPADIGVSPDDVQARLVQCGLGEARAAWAKAKNDVERGGEGNLFPMDAALLRIGKSRKDINVTDGAADDLVKQGALHTARLYWSSIQKEIHDIDRLHGYLHHMDQSLKTAGKTREDIGASDALIDQKLADWPLLRARHLWTCVQQNGRKKDACDLLADMDFVLMLYGFSRFAIEVSEEMVADELSKKT
jgi:hypothetical protein